MASDKVDIEIKKVDVPAVLNLLRAQKKPGLELGGVAEMSEEFGVPRTTASMWDDPDRRRTNGFPKPLARLAMGPVFDMAEVRAWWRSKALARAEESREVVESS